MLNDRGKELSESWSLFGDQWDNFDSEIDDDDDDEDFFRQFIKSPLTSPGSNHGSEGYGTDTSDAFEKVDPVVTNSHDSVRKDVSTDNAVITQQRVFPKEAGSAVTSAGTKALKLVGETSVHNRPTIIRVTPTAKVGLKETVNSSKPSSTAKIYHISKLDISSNAKIATQTRKTVLLKVIRPTTR